MKKKLSRVLALLCALALTFAMLPPVGMVFAEETPATSGECGAEGSNVQWSFDAETGTLTISGTGAIKDYSIEAFAPWSSYTGSIQTIIIGNSITKIGDRAFYGCSPRLTSITIPNSVTKIGEGSFVDCSNLSSVTIPNSVTSIGDSCFSGCSITNMTLPNSIKNIGQYAFTHCFNLTSVTIPDGITNIEEGTFSNCENLKSVAIPDSVTIIGEGAFKSCTSLTNIAIPNDVTSIGESVFEGCSSLTNIVIPNNVTSIGRNAFAECDNLKSVKIPDSITYIAYRAFFNCDNLTSVTIPSSVTDIETEAFACCNNLEAINVDINNQQYYSIDGVLYSNFFGQRILQVPAGTIGVFEIGNDISHIEASAFANCSHITDIIIPNSVTDISIYAFSGCNSLKNITIPGSIYEINSFVFSECNNLTSVIISNGITHLDSAAFQGCSNLTSITIPNSVTVIGPQAFNRCGNLKDVYYGGTEEQWKDIEIDILNDDLTSATIHYNSPDLENPIGNYDSVRYLSSYNVTNKTVQFDVAPSDIGLNYTLADTVDTTNLEQLVGKYVYVRSLDNSNIFTLASIQPVETKIGIFTVEGDHVANIDGISYPVTQDILMSSLDFISGKKSLIHLYNGEIVGYSLITSQTGVFQGWDSQKQQVTIADKVYPSNYLSDLSFTSDENNLMGLIVAFEYISTNGYTPILSLKKDDSVAQPEIQIKTYASSPRLEIAPGETLELFSIAERNGIHLKWSAPSLTIGDSSIVSISDGEMSDTMYQFRIEGKKIGTTSLVITDTVTGKRATLTIKVKAHDQNVGSIALNNVRSYTLTEGFQKTQTNFYDLDGLSMNGYQANRNADGSYDISFNLYNDTTIYASVDIYNAQGTLIKTCSAAPHFAESNLWEVGKSLFYLVHDTISSSDSSLSYTSPIQSTHSPISFHLPKGGYFTISSNITKSPGAMMYNIVDMMLYCAQQKIKKDFPKSATDLITDNIVSRISTSNSALSRTFDEIFIKNITNKLTSMLDTKKLTLAAYADYMGDVGVVIDDFWDVIDIDFDNIAVDTLRTAFDLGEEIFTGVEELFGPAGTALKTAFSFIEKANRLGMGYRMVSSVNFSMIIFTYPSDNEKTEFQINDVTVETFSPVEDKETVLRVYKLVENGVQFDAIDVPPDQSTLYNICFVKNDQEVKVDGNVTVRIPIPPRYNKTHTTVYRQEEDGSWTQMETRLDGNYLVFETSHLSVYAVVDTGKEIHTTDPSNPDNPTVPENPSQPTFPTTPDTPSTSQPITRPSDPAKPLGQNWKGGADSGWQYLQTDGTPVTGSRWIEAEGHRYLFDANGTLLTGADATATAADGSTITISPDGDILMSGNLYYLSPDRDVKDPRTCYVVTDYLRIRDNYAGQTYYDQDGITFVGWMKYGKNGLRYQTRIPQPDKPNDLYLIVWRIQTLPECQHPDYPGDAAHNMPAGRYFFDDEGVLVQKGTWNDGKDGKEYYTNANGIIIQERTK